MPNVVERKQASREEDVRGETTGRDRTFPFFQTSIQKEGALPAKKKPPTRSSEHATPDGVPFPEPEEFRPHLRRLAVSAVQVLLEHVMREEWEQGIGASWGECTPTRRGSRHGSSTRDLVTATGRIADRNVPRDREGVFQTQAFERSQRSEPEVALCPDAHVGERSEYSRHGKRAANVDRGGPQRQHRQSSQSHPDGAI